MKQFSYYDKYKLLYLYNFRRCIIRSISTSLKNHIKLYKISESGINILIIHQPFEPFVPNFPLPYTCTYTSGHRNPSLAISFHQPPEDKISLFIPVMKRSLFHNL